MERIMQDLISFQAHFGPQMLNAVKSYVKITMIVNIGLGFSSSECWSQWRGECFQLGPL